MDETIEGGAASATSEKRLPEKLAAAIVAESLPAIAADDDGEVLGALNLAFDEPHTFSHEELELIEILARECRRAMLLGQRVRDELAGRRPRVAAES